MRLFIEMLTVVILFVVFLTTGCNGWTTMVPITTLRNSQGKCFSTTTKTRTSFFRQQPPNGRKLYSNNGDDEKEEEETNKKEKEEVVYYDDFDLTIGPTSTDTSTSSSNKDITNYNDFDFTIGPDTDGTTTSSSSSVNTSSSSKLKNRIRELQKEELRKETRLLQNWKTGDWSVRGFSLDTEDAYQQAAQQQSSSESEPIYISNIVSDNNHNDRIWVGRTDGSLLWVELGTDPITHFRSQLVGRTTKTTTEEGKSEQSQEGISTDDNSNKEDTTEEEMFTIASELVPDKDISSTFSQPPGQNEPTKNDDDELETMSIMSNPFEILSHIQTNKDKKSISCILSVLDEDYVFTSYQGNGNIQQWKISDDDDDDDDSTTNKQIPVRNLVNAHSDTIVSMKTVSYSNNKNKEKDIDVQMLFSASVDGTIALWDIYTGDLIYKSQLTLDAILQEEDEEKDRFLSNEKNYNEEDSSSSGVQIHCADYDSDNNNIYIGTSTGYVLVYNIQTLVESTLLLGSSVENEDSSPVSSLSSPQPDGKFLAHESGVTAIICAGEGSLGRGRPNTKSTILVTGGAKDGTVKQWEMISMSSSSSSSVRLEVWPKLKNQRLPKKAHIFEGHDENYNICALVGNNNRIISASKDGTIRVWNPSASTTTSRSKSKTISTIQDDFLDTNSNELYRMDGFNDSLSSLCIVGGSVDNNNNNYNMLITNGMNQYVCVHDFDMNPDDVISADSFILDKDDDDSESNDSDDENNDNNYEFF